MEDLKKVSSRQLYTFWKNLSIGLLVVVGLIALSALLPFTFFSPILALIAAAVLYTMLYNNKLTHKSSCMLVIYAIFISCVSFSFITIITNILDVWQLLPWNMPKELSIFSNPFIPTLLFDPICFITFIVIYIRRSKLRICIDCRLSKGEFSDRGKLGRILYRESGLQLKNLIFLFGILSVAVWYYYILHFVDAELNARDNYIFVWLNVIGFILDEVYFIIRYMNLYLELRENDEIISQEDLRDMTNKTYLRFYLICGNDVFMSTNVADPRRTGAFVIDSPFFTKRSVNGITIPEVNMIIRRMTGIKNGRLKFFFGRKTPDLERHSTLRYFYFLDGKKEDYQDIPVDGEWMDFETLKKIYSFNPEKLSSIMVSDITRMATIILTQKIFDENGFRKNKLRSYRPSFNLIEVDKNDYDFQDDKWIRISMFNSDTKLYRIKRWWRGIGMPERKNNSKEEWN